jgi:lipopolysaccharide transport system ATP-binding protein
VAREGRTVMFVSHNMSAIRELCPRSIWLDEGRVRADGPSGTVIDDYLLSINKPEGAGETLFEEDVDQVFRVRSSRFVDASGLPRHTFEVSDPPVVELKCRVSEAVPGLYGYVVLSRTDGTIVLEADSYDTTPNPLDNLEPGEHVIRIAFPPRTLGPGSYAVYVSFASMFAMDDAAIHSPREVGTFVMDDFTSRRGNRRSGFLSMPLDWQVVS